MAVLRPRSRFGFMSRHSAPRSLPKNFRTSWASSIGCSIGLPASSTIRVRIISVNDAGEAPPSEVVEFVTPVNV